MKNFTINKLWDLRAELDGAIISKDYEKIKEVKEKYKSLVEGEWMFSRAFICYNNAFWTIAERQSHNFQNVLSIQRNIENYEKKYIDGKDVSLKLKTQKNTGFLAGEIWTLRAMYDKFLLQCVNKTDDVQTQQNMILGRAILNKLMALTNVNQVEDYYSQMLPIIKEVREAYESSYGINQPRIDYSQLSDEFWEK